MKAEIKVSLLAVACIGIFYFLGGVFGCNESNNPYLCNNVVKIKIFNEYGYAGMGSGFLYEDGKIMTAGHVVGDANSFTIIYADGSEEISTSAIKSRYDLGIILVNKECQYPVVWNPKELQRGTTVYLEGFPYDSKTMYLSKGIASSEEWDIYIWPSIISVDISSEPGNSGGPLIDTKGRVCGVLVGGRSSVSLCVPGKVVYDFVENPIGKNFIWGKEAVRETGGSSLENSSRWVLPTYPVLNR